MCTAMSATADVPVYIKDRNSGLVLEYKPHNNYEVVLENKQAGNLNQQWTLTSSGVAGYIYIQSKADASQAAVISAGDKPEEPLHVAPKFGLSKNQLWILRQPDSSSNPNFVLMSADTGLVMDVAAGGKSPGTQLQVFYNHTGPMQQFSFEQ